MRTSDQIDQIGAALAKAQGQMTHASFDATNPAFRSKYATLQSVISAVREPFAANGIGWLQSIESVENGVYAVTRLIHASGQWIELDGPIVPIEKGNAHGAGSATTYAKRFGLALVGIGADEDDDGNAAVEAAPARQPVKAERKPPAKAAPKAEVIGDAERAELERRLAALGKEPSAFAQYIGVPSLAELPIAKLAAATAALSAAERKVRASEEATA